MKILLTAFDPFGGDKTNPALEAVKGVKGTVAGAEIVKLMVPTVFGKSIDVVSQAMEEHQPDAVLAIGLAAGRFGLCPERVAINIDDARIADNEGSSRLIRRCLKMVRPHTFLRCRLKPWFSP